MRDLQRDIRRHYATAYHASLFTYVYIYSQSAQTHLATSKPLPEVSHSVEQFHIIVLLGSIGRSLRTRGVACQRLNDLVVRPIECERLRRCHRLADSTHRRQSSVDEVSADVLCSAQGR